MSYVIRIKRGVKKDMPKFADDGELMYMTDTSELFIGRGKTIPAVKISDGLSWYGKILRKIKFWKKATKNEV